MIEISNISKKFGDNEVLKDISGLFQKTYTSLIIGASGTGKSVLLKCIVGLIKPDQGKVLYDGRDFWNCDNEEKKRIRSEIGMLFQGNALFDSKSVYENVGFPLNMMDHKMPKSEKHDRVMTSLQRVGLEKSAQLMPSEISGGMKKRVALARAIVMRPKYLFCDEPNSGLDPQTSITIDNLISEITDDYQMTTIIVSHDMNSVMEIGEAILFMHKGQKVWEGSNQNILDSSVKELNDFVFANKMARSFREAEELLKKGENK